MKTRYNQRQTRLHLNWLAILILCLTSFQQVTAKDKTTTGDNPIIASCDGISTWSSSVTYLGGNRVRYNGTLYEAKWWNQNRNPETNSGRDDEWRNLGPCDGDGGPNTPPTVQVTSPSDGSTFTEGSSITIAASSADSDGTVVKVEFFNNDILLGEDTSAPFNFTISNAQVGEYRLIARATDNLGAETVSSPVSIRVNASGGGGDGGSCAASLYIDGSPYDTGDEVQNDGRKYECLIAGWCSVGGPYEPGVGWAWENAWKDLGECGGSTPDNQNPTVSITEPSNGSRFEIGQTVNITASASDADGSVIKVEFFINGNKISEDTTAPYTSNWTTVSGTHTILAKATDDKGATSDSIAVAISAGSTNPPTTGLPARILNGYWHNFQNGSGLIPLRDVSPAWDVINISFAEPKISSTDGDIGFELSSDFDAIGYTASEFKSDVQLLQSQGKKIIISIGGAEGQVRLNSISARDKFINSMISIIEEYGFDGMDIDFEGNSLSFELGDTDFTNPTTPVIVNTIDAVRSVCNHFGNDFILTMAPETFFVQLGYQFYGGISSGADRRAGAYLPLIHALRDKLTFLQVQYYNSGPITALDDQFYSMGNSDFYVSLVDMLLKGFPITKDSSKFFPALRPDQVLIGVPATVNAGNGHTGSNGVITALDYLINNNSFGGQYQLSQTYPNLRGVMSWSINWDAFENRQFSNAVRAYLDGIRSRMSRLRTDPKLAIEDPVFKIFPNPLTRHLFVQIDVPIKTFRIRIYDLSGHQVFEFEGSGIKQQTNTVNLELEHLEAGIYYYTSVINNKRYTGRILKE